MPAHYRRRIHCAFAEPEKPKRKPAKKQSEMIEDERLEADAKRIARKGLKTAKDEWEKTLPAPYAQGIYKSDAKSYFGLTDKDIETLPHEAIQNSPKTFYALSDVRRLSISKSSANALPLDFTLAGEPKDGSVRFFKKDSKPSNRRVRTNWYDHGVMHWFLVESMYLKGAA
ncbi:hypothetical protein C8Q74DRAFT_1287334 [Fomes fomentarius]|nr:hypothetical protein C8Q74DRAFT_1287334 [Fomes fomentarius]